MAPLDVAAVTCAERIAAINKFIGVLACKADLNEPVLELWTGAHAPERFYLPLGEDGQEAMSSWHPSGQTAYTMSEAEYALRVAAY